MAARRPYFADKELQAESDLRWDERLRIFREVFPWVDREIQALTGLPSDTKFGSGDDDDNQAMKDAGKRYRAAQEDDAEVLAIHDRQNEEWRKLTPRPPLRSIKDWVEVAALTGIPRREFASHELRTIADAIIDWARRKLDGEPIDSRGRASHLPVEVDVENYVVTIDGALFLLQGGATTKQRLAGFVTAVVEAKGQPVSATDYNLEDSGHRATTCRGSVTDFCGFCQTWKRLLSPA